MYFSFVATILAFAFSANAASVNKRVDIGTPAQTCITSLVSLNQALGYLDVAANNITASAGYAGMLKVHGIEQSVETNITAAETSCCAITSTLTGSDATAVLAEESTVANSYSSVFNSFINALPQIQKVLLYDTLMKADFINIYNKTVPLLDCLTSMMPSDSTNAAQRYATNIENNIQKAITAFTKTTTTAVATPTS